MIGIYKIENLINHKMYIGQTIDFNRRIYLHIHYLNANRHCNKYLQRSWNEYGSENFKFELIEDFSNNQCDRDTLKKLLDEREIFWIKFYKSSNFMFGYNLSEGGDGATLLGERNPSYGVKKSDEVRTKISNTIRANKSHSGERNGRYGKPVSDETRRKISNANKGRVQSEQERAMRSVAMRNANMKLENIAKRESRKLDPERKQLFAEYGKARRKYTDEFVANIRSEYTTDVDIPSIVDKYNLSRKLVMEIVHHNGHFKYR